MVYDQQMRNSTRLGIGGVIKVNKVSAVLMALLSGLKIGHIYSDTTQSFDSS